MKKVIILLISISLFISCKKKPIPEPEPLPPPDTSGDINVFFSKNTTQTQTFSINSASVQTIVGVKGTTVTIPNSAFKTKSGGVTVLGVFELSLVEIYGKKDMILNKTQSASVDDLLITAGQVKITAKQGDEDLMLITAKTLTISYPVTSTPGSDMIAAYGDPNYLTNNISWTLDSVGIDNSAIPVITPFSYQLVSDSIEWVGCSKPITSVNPKTNFTVTLHGNYNSSNTKIFITFPTVKSVGYLNDTGTQSFSNSYKLPVGSAFTIVAIAKINGKFYASYTATTMTANLVKDLNLTETTEADILTNLGTL